jgi:hypothetical protein
MLLMAVGAQATLLTNGDFSAGNVNEVPPSWTNVGLGPSYIPIINGQQIPPGDVWQAEHINFGGAADAGYLYQQVNVGIGVSLDASVSYCMYSGGQEPDSWHTFGIGIDPTGGTDYNAGSVAKAEVNPPSRSTWYSVGLTGVVSTAETVTVFLYSGMADDNAGWWAHAFDNAELTPEPATIALLGLGALALRRRRR